MLTDAAGMPAALRLLLDRIRGGRTVAVVVVTTTGTKTVPMRERDLRRIR